MLNFNLHTTTEIVFGKDIEEQIGPRLKELGAHRILVHFGGSSARTSGLAWRWISIIPSAPRAKAS